MAGIWYRAGTVSVTNGSKKVTGFGTQWATSVVKPKKGHAVHAPDGRQYELDYVESDTVMYLVTAYAGVTATGQAYAIDITRSDTIPAFSRDLAAFTAYTQGQYDSWQQVLTGTGTVKLTAPDGQQIQVPALSALQPASASLKALQALTPAADKMVYYTSAATAAMTTLTSFARTLLDDVSAQAMRGTIGSAVAFYNLTTENLNDLTEYGLYAQQASASATLALNYPMQEAGNLVLRPTAYLYQQEYTTFNSLRKFIRNRSASSVWSAWVEVYTQKSILGDVSQSAGVPTGAILRRGSNANGEYLQMADGTQICWRNWTANLAVTSDNTPYTGYYCASLGFTYPVAFVATPTLTAGARATGYTTPVANGDLSAAGGALYITSNKAITARDYVLSYVAIGRWF
ncbi:pyocin knob domain-containing protein [Aeromonas caviae]|uniref:Pyocin knob domain-containing protein n=1 Tax=Aeromonas caviae TaxID=648 RepID=A0AA42VBR4_AERCA|nr:pyocin knob domain-containing protein [Aeromonas caviae]MDH1897848.1 pyocin knob domain-containing protein [Aeromonas caviae]